MENLHIDELIAERNLDFKSNDGRQKTIKVRLGKPMPAEKGDWLCPYEIIGFNKAKGLEVYGVDAMQALLLAIKSLSADLRVSARNENGEITWLDNKDGGFSGFL